MRFIKKLFLFLFVLFIGTLITDVIIDNTTIAVYVGLIISVIITFKPQHLLSNSKGNGSLFNPNGKIPEETIEYHRNQLVDQFTTGDLAKHFHTNVFLKKGEKLIFDIPGIQICEEKTIKLKGSHGGFSVRVMKGLSYRFGNFEASSEKRVTPLDTGHFILTSKRLIFSGAKKSLDVSLSKIVAAKPVENGILIDRTAKQNVEYFIGLDNLKMDMTLVPEEHKGETWKEQKVKFKLNGFDVRQIIQGVIQAE
jgi:hypothetical protein